MTSSRATNTRIVDRPPVTRWDVFSDTTNHSPEPFLCNSNHLIFFSSFNLVLLHYLDIRR